MLPDSALPHSSDRRRWIALAGAATLSLAARPLRASAAEVSSEQKEMEVAAVEDLMREHGVLRRALLVYSEAASRLARGAADVPADALARTAALFRSFGEDYHERSLEEKHVFPPIIEAGGRLASLSRTLVAQHERGRQITDYVTAVTRTGRVGSADATPLTDALEGFVRMYRHHAAIEDTVIFPAWKEAIPRAQYRELSEQFEELEHSRFGEDGFDDAVQRIAAAEKAFGIADLSNSTAPPPKAVPNDAAVSE